MRQSTSDEKTTRERERTVTIKGNGYQATARGIYSVEKDAVSPGGIDESTRRGGWLTEMKGEELEGIGLAVCRMELLEVDLGIGYCE